MLPIIKVSEIDTFLDSATGSVSILTDTCPWGTKTTAVFIDGRWASKRFASDYMRDIRNAEFAAIPKPAPLVATGKRSEPYAGPFPRGKHSHRCVNCGGNAVACYKAKCTQAQTVSRCRWC